MPPSTEVSRRDLFSLGLSRLREQAARELTPAPSPPGRGQRLRHARAEADSGDLWAPVRARLDALAGPLPDGATSLFGPMFSADHGRALSELFAAAGPGGTIAFTAWTPLGVVGRLLRVAAQLDPPSPGTPAALAWGREERLRQDLECYVEAPELRFETLDLRFADEEEARVRLCRALPPVIAVPDQGELEARAAAVIAELAVGDEGGGVVLPARYLIAIAWGRPR